MIKKMAVAFIVVVLAVSFLALPGKAPAASEMIKVLVNGHEIAMDVSPILRDGRVLVPVRWVAAALGADVSWQEGTNTVSINSLAPAGVGRGEYAIWRQVAELAAGEAWRLMGERPKELAVLTNAGYAAVGGFTTEACLDGLAASTGCSAGQANLLDVHTSRDKPLWFFFFDKITGRGVYSEVNGTAALGLLTAPGTDPADLPADRLFTKLALENIAADRLLADPAAWNKKVAEKVFGGFEFGIVTIANVAAKGAPYDFIKTALFHDHLCPGVTSGYLLANYLKKELPLRSPTESYYILAVPPWCKDDALAVLLNTTPGKSGMAVIPMNDMAKENLKPEAQNLAGIYFRYDSKSKKGDGVVLSYDFNKGAALSGIDLNKGFPWESRLRYDLWYLGYLDKPEIFIQTIKKFELKESEKPADYAQPGVNPLVELGLVK